MRKRNFTHRPTVKPTYLTVGLSFAVSLAVWAQQKGPSSAQAAPPSRPSQVTTSTAVPQPAPAFILPDVDGKTHSLTDYRGQPVTLYFYCGCVWCHRCAQAWSGVQRSGALAQMAAKQLSASPHKTSVGAGHTPLTLVVFTGDAEEARSFAKETQLDPKQTLFLLDQDEKVSPLYQATPCPRVFILDPQGKIRYTNNEQGKDSYKIPAPLIVARAVDALRAVSAGTVSPSATPKVTSTHATLEQKPVGKSLTKPTAARK
ncbi:MAG: redoxin domain-containing protein [Abitibacteriaceae bacterium]|nr:redoxin domain-containing protein [Abditibacteriaceae bacterium]